jgi:hypothetical protein
MLSMTETEDQSTTHVRHWKRALLVVAAVLLSCTLLCVVAGSIIYPEFVGPSVTSPDRAFSAQVRESDCGATCGFETTVTLVYRRA